MIRPHGSNVLMPLYVGDDEHRQALLREAERLPSIIINSSAAANAVMLGAGYFTPLTGYMNRADSMSVAETMQTSDGLLWPIPIINLVQTAHNIELNQSLALRDPNVNGNPILAVMTVKAIEQLSRADISSLSKNIFSTEDSEHPGVASFLSQGNLLLSGPVTVFNYSYFATDFVATFRTAVQIRQAIADRGWNKVVAFQTRNPMHRAHEELCRMAMADTRADGLLIHMLLGQLKPDDIPAQVRDAAIRSMVKHYFPKDRVLVTGYGFDMLYAGPREAVLHAIFRQNAGCTHLIVGRDHAGVGNYYGAFDAQAIFDTLPKGALAIKIYPADHTAYSKKLNKVVMMRDAPDHSKEDFVLLSGTRVREMLCQGIAPPTEFSRPEVTEILMNYYQNL